MWLQRIDGRDQGSKDALASFLVGNCTTDPFWDRDHPSYLHRNRSGNCPSHNDEEHNGLPCLQEDSCPKVGTVSVCVLKTFLKPWNMSFQENSKFPHEMR